MAADFARVTLQRVVVVVRLLIVPRLHCVLHLEVRLRVGEDILSQILESDVRLTERRLTVLEDATLRPELTQASQLWVVAQYFHVGGTFLTTQSVVHVDDGILLLHSDAVHDGASFSTVRVGVDGLPALVDEDVIVGLVDRVINKF